MSLKFCFLPQVEHPAAKMIVMAANMQEQEVTQRLTTLSLLYPLKVQCNGKASLQL